MSVKDVLQSLVDDALVDTDRIGTSNYFWSFPSKAANNVSIPYDPPIDHMIWIFEFSFERQKTQFLV